MNVENECNLASRYRTVRKHLDGLGYEQILPLDALSLVENLLADLIQTTESLKHFKSVAQDSIESCSQLQLAVDPYKCDNARLVQENNELHFELMREKESHQKQLADLKRNLRKIELEYGDLQLASSRNLQRIKELETESAKKSKKILELQAAKKRSCYPLRRPVFECEALPKTKSSPGSLQSAKKVEPEVVDFVVMADHRMNCLNHEVTKLKEELTVQTDNVNTLEIQLALKEKEILRLRKMLEGGRPYTAVSKDCSCKRSEKSHSLRDCCEGSEMKILQQAKCDLERQLKDALNKQHEAMTQALKLAERNEELEKELRDIDHIALAVEADCNSAVKENNRRVCRLQEKLEVVITQVHALESELAEERRRAQELKMDLDTSKIEKSDLQRILESTLDEKKRMTDRINQLTINEKNLSEDLEKVTKECECQKQEAGKLLKECEFQKKEVKKLSKEREIQKDEMKKFAQGGEGDELNKLKERVEQGEKNEKNKGKKTLKKKTASKSRKSSLSPSRQDNNISTNNRNSNQEEEIVKEDNSQISNDLQKILYEKESTINALQNKLSVLEAERDYFRGEYNKFREQFSKNSSHDNAESWMQTCELKRKLFEKERALAELTHEKKALCREKFNLEARLQGIKPLQKRTCVSCSPCKLCDYSPSVPSGGDVNAKAILDRLERERDSARADVERLVEERDALHERLKIATEAHTSEQRRLRESLHDVETRLKHIERERQELLMTQGTRRATINGLEEQLEDMKEELKRTKQELSDQRTQYFQLRALQDQTDQALGDVQGQLSQSETELIKATDRNRNMEQRQLQLDNQVKGLKQEINTLRASMTQLDQDKDQLLMILDEKTERIAALERELQSKEQQALGVEQKIRELQHRNQICVDQSAEQERQVRSMQIEIDNLQRQLTSSSIDRENAIQENRRLQDDLAAVTCEVRNLQRELDVSRAESFDLKRQLQTYVSEVRRAEELLNKKENERTEMLNHFRSLSLEATVLENSNHSLETEAAEARGALQSTRDRLIDLERQVADKDYLIRGYEAQIADLTQNVATLETQMRQQEDQRERAEADLNAVRDLCVKLDQQKDNLVQQLADKDSLKSQFESQMNRLRTENSMVQDQMNRDHAAIERLEELLDQARKESINTQTSNQELQNEVSRLKQKIADLQSKLSSESAELRRYQNQAAEYNKQISELRRQVTNERFDRARKDEETRRSQQTNPPNPPNTPQETLRTSSSRQLSPNASWNLTTRSCQHAPKVNGTSPGIPAWMANRFGRKTLICRCANCLTSRKSQFSLHEGHKSVCVVQIPGENQDIRVQIIDMTSENAVSSFDTIEEENEKKSREKELKNKELDKDKLEEENEKEIDTKEKESMRSVKEEQKTSTKDNNSFPKDSSIQTTETERQIQTENYCESLMEKIFKLLQKLEEHPGKLKEKKKIELGKKEIESRSVKEMQKKSTKTSISFPKKSNVQTAGTESQIQTERRYSLAEKILKTLQSLEEPPQMRQDVSIEPDFETNFLSVESRSVGTDTWDRTFPNFESRGVQSMEIFRLRPYRTNSAATSNLDRTTSGYSSSSHKTWISHEHFVRRLVKEDDCCCCGTEGTSRSRRNLKNLEDDRNVNDDKEKKKVSVKEKSDNCPSIIQVLLQIGEHTHSLERELAKMNESIKTTRENGVAFEINERNALRSPGKSPGKEVPKLCSEGKKEDSNGNKVLTLERENVPPVGNSTPIFRSVRNEEQSWVSFPDYTGSDINDWIRQEEENFIGIQNAATQSEAEDLDASPHISGQNEVSPLIIIPSHLPVASSTPNLEEGECPLPKKTSLNNSRTSKLQALKSPNGRRIPVLKKSSLNEKKKPSPFAQPGPSVQTQTSNSRINAATSTSEECLELVDEKNAGGYSKSSVRSLDGKKRKKTDSISTDCPSTLDTTEYLELP